MNQDLLEKDIIKISNELNDLFFISQTFKDNLFLSLMGLISIFLFIAIIIFYQDFHHKKIKENYEIDEKYNIKIKKIEKFHQLIAIIFLFMIVLFGLLFIYELLTFDNDDKKIDEFVEKNREELIEMFATSSTYEITYIMTGNTYKNNYFITYKDENILGQLLTDSKTKIKKSNENKITFYETIDTIKVINKMNNKGIKLNNHLLDIIKNDLPYYEIEANTIN